MRETTFVIEFATAGERDAFVRKLRAESTQSELGIASAEALDLRGSRRGRFAATVVVPISLGIAGNLATDIVRDAAKAAWQEILVLAQEIPAIPIKGTLSDPPDLVDPKLPLTPDPHRSRKKGDQRGS